MKVEKEERKPPFRMHLSVVIPVFNEGKRVEKTLSSLSPYSCERIVVDGGSRDETVPIAERYTSHVLVSRPCRGLQQDVGARRARGEILLFLHADTFLPPDFEDLILKTLADSSVILGAFRLRFYPRSPWLRIVAFAANLRSRVFQLPYGDQAFFMRRSDYFKVGGFKAFPLMEDVDLVRRVKKVGRVRIAKGEVRTSARRWEKRGNFSTTLGNALFLLKYCRGTSPDILARTYYGGGASQKGPLLQEESTKIEGGHREKDENERWR
jgi:rSAM/selenodomain-associated transferase 2